MERRIENAFPGPCPPPPQAPYYHNNNNNNTHQIHPSHHHVAGVGFQQYPQNDNREHGFNQQPHFDNQQKIPDKLYVRCLNKQTTRTDVHEVFCRFGVIGDIYMAVDDMNVSRGLTLTLHLQCQIGTHNHIPSGETKNLQPLESLVSLHNLITFRSKMLKQYPSFKTLRILSSIINLRLPAWRIKKSVTGVNTLVLMGTSIISIVSLAKARGRNQRSTPCLRDGSTGYKIKKLSLPRQTVRTKMQ
ncbi:uncharacterized protein LOC108846105 isoform X2 [Raphanus sativus]|uniref:Uncharacterized protein LOC108846105 isoform X2 n=1 Tax=Raphanus sativus TaxID=3726 RepID=A0A6J0MQR3_RAPSA|nr:uncharacterized protein LOC108846105 isoform X2 [Raphanus sativus]